MGGRILLAGVLGLLCGVAPAAAQSLADIAKKEQARRESVPAPGKTYTNADLTPDLTGQSTGEEPSTVEAGGSVEPAADQDSEGSEAGGTGASASAPEPLLDEAVWRRQASALRARVESARAAFERASRPSGGDERQQARVAELRANAEGVLARAEAALAAFEERARAEGVPEEWIR